MKKKIYFSLIIIIAFFSFCTNIKAEEEIHNNDEKNINEEIYGDIDDNKETDINDVEKLIDNILNEEEISNNDINNDQKVDINDVTSLSNYINTGNKDNNTILEDELVGNLDQNTQIEVNQEIDINYNIDGFDKNYINGISGEIDYDKNLLELDSINIESKYGDINNKGKFIYLLDDYNKNTSLFKLKFRTIKEGSAYIFLHNLKLSSSGNEVLLNTHDLITYIDIIKKSASNNIDNNPNKEGNKLIRINTTTNNITKPSFRKENTNKVIYVISDTGKKIGLTNINLSNDNYIKSLIIKNYKINFDKNTLEYNIDVENEVNNLDLIVILNNNNASYEIIGNEKFKTGPNKVLIEVTAEDGEKRIYTINVNKLKQVNKEKNSNSSKIVIIILIILIIIGLIYVIFKEDEEENNNIKKNKES